MRKLTMTCAVILATGLAAAPIATGGETKKVPTSLSAKYKGVKASDPYGTSAFKGTVGPRKCAKGRKVSVSGYGSTKTEPNGKFTLAVSSPAKPGKYKVKVAAKEHGGLLCKKAKAVVKVK